MMNSTETTVNSLISKKEAPIENVCQCCLSRFNSEFSKQTETNDTIENYLHMILYCFNIKIMKKENIEFFICEICAAKLQYSCVFKNQVEEAQFRLIQKADDLIEVPVESYNDKCDDFHEDYSSGEEYNLPNSSPTAPKKLKKERQKEKKKKKKKEESETLKFPCIVCKERFESMKILRNHRLTHRSDYICPTCGKSFKNGSSFRAHQLTHSHKVRCNICNKMISQNSVRTHQLLHKGYLIYACRLCPKRFNSHLPRNKHRAEEHGVPMPVHRCEQCPGEFNCASALTKHVRRMHHCEKNFSCPDCNMAFFYAAELKQHMIVHTGERNFECEFCHKRFGRHKTMKQHMKTHVNETNAASGPSTWGSYLQ